MLRNAGKEEKKSRTRRGKKGKSHPLYLNPNKLFIRPRGGKKGGSRKRSIYFPFMLTRGGEKFKKRKKEGREKVFHFGSFSMKR